MRRLAERGPLELAATPDWAQDALQPAPDTPPVPTAALRGSGEAVPPGYCGAGPGEGEGKGGDSVRKSTRKRKLQHENLAGELCPPP